MAVARTIGGILLVLALGVVAGCGDDDDASTGTTTAETSTSSTTVADDSSDDADTPAASDVEASGDPDDPCSLLTAEDFTAVLDASVDDPEDATGRFGLGGSPTGDSEPKACQWQATVSDGASISSFSVEVITVTGSPATGAYDDEVAFARSMQSIDVQDAELPGLEAVSMVDDGEPDIVALADGLALKVSTAADDLPVEDLADLAERALRRAGVR